MPVLISAIPVLLSIDVFIPDWPYVRFLRIPIILALLLNSVFLLASVACEAAPTPSDANSIGPSSSTWSGWTSTEYPTETEDSSSTWNGWTSTEYPTETEDSSSDSSEWTTDDSTETETDGSLSNSFWNSISEN
jgi:hypothetical protein